MGSVLIAGLGAIGTWLAVRMHATGNHHVTAWVRPERLDVVQAGLRLETALAARRAPEAPEREVAQVATAADPAALPPAPDLLVVAVRAYQTDEAAAMLAAHVRPRVVLTLQNGLGNAEALVAHFPEATILAGTTSHGVTARPPDGAYHAGPGDTVLGPWRPDGADDAAQVAGWLKGAGIATDVVADPRLALWQKVAVNAAINPPTALHRVPNGALLDGGPLEEDLRAAAREVALVARAEGQELRPEAAEAAALRVARRTAENRSSMLQALEAGRRLETDAITGEVVARAARHGIEVPVNARHLAALRRLHVP